MISKKKDLPIYLKTSVSAQFLAKNPQYKKVFAKCPNCSKYSLKPLGIRNVKDIQQNIDDNERKCVCGYTHVRNLSVCTEPSSKAAIEGRILYYVNAKIT